MKFFIAISLLLSCVIRKENLNASDSGNRAYGNAVDTVSKNIMVIYQDKRDTYWLGSWQDGLYKFDGHSIIHYTSKDGLPSNRIEEIKEDKAGNLFINTSKGVCKFDGNSFLKLIEVVNIRNNWKSGKDDLWFKCTQKEGYIYRYDGAHLYPLQMPKVKIGEDYIAKHPSPLSPYSVYTIYKDDHHNIWFGTSVLGVCRYNGNSFDWITEEDVNELHNGPSNGVRGIAQDREGNFWFNTNFKYEIYNQKNSTPQRDFFYTRAKSIGSLDGKKDGSIHEYLSITKDNSQNIWIATYRDGVWKYDGKEVKHYEIIENGKQINIFYIYKDNQGAIWLGTHSNGVYTFDKDRFVKHLLIK